MNSESGQKPRVTSERAERLVQTVRRRYGRIAEGLESGCGGATDQDGGSKARSGCCGNTDPASVAAAELATSRRLGYDDEELAAVPEHANLGLGCGAPIAGLELRPGEVVLDLGSGGGLDAFLASPRVGPSGRVIGVDMTPEMIARARENARNAGVSNVEFRSGRLEALPVEDASIDAVTSNCVINLVPDKARVFREIYRVLKPGGRLVISDIVLDGALPQAVADDLLAYVGCVSGAMQREDYFAAIAEAGLGGVRILKDADFLQTLDADSYARLVGIVRDGGGEEGDLTGRVRSLTFHAEKA